MLVDTSPIAKQVTTSEGRVSLMVKQFECSRS